MTDAEPEAKPLTEEEEEARQAARDKKRFEFCQNKTRVQEETRAEEKRLESLTEEQKAAEAAEAAKPVSKRVSVQAADVRKEHTHVDERGRRRMDMAEMEVFQSLPVGERADVALIRALFNEADTQNHGGLSKEEFRMILCVLDPTTWTKKEGQDCPVEKLFEAADTDHNGTIECQELIDWVLGGRKAVDQESESDSDASSSSSGSSIDEATHEKLKAKIAGGESAGHRDSTPCSASKKSDKLKRQAKRNNKNEEPMTDMEEMYELLTMKDGRISNRLLMDEFLFFFYEMTCDGLGLQLARLVTQTVTIKDRLPEELSLCEVAQIVVMLKDNPEATLDDAQFMVSVQKSLCRGPRIEKREDREADLKLQIPDLDLELTISFKHFQRIMEILTGLMQVDMEHLLACFAWERTSRFEMTDSMAMAIMERGLLKVALPGHHILDTSISENDFVRMSHAMNIIDRTEKKGIAHGKLAILFGSILRHMPRLRLERERRRYADRGSLEKERPRKRKHLHRRMMGRTQLAVLFEELFKKIPANRALYRSPLNLVLSLLEIADDDATGRAKSSALHAGAKDGSGVEDGSLPHYMVAKKSEKTIEREKVLYESTDTGAHSMKATKSLRKQKTDGHAEDEATDSTKTTKSLKHNGPVKAKAAH